MHTIKDILYGYKWLHIYCTCGDYFCGANRANVRRQFNQHRREATCAKK